MDSILDELSVSLPDAREALRVIIRLLAALLAGGVIGLQRELAGKAAGLRTHILVSMGMTVLVVAAAQAGMGQDAMSRVIQGLVTGIGFIGAGVIMKMESQHQIHGLTTAAGIWMTSAIGIAIGLGHLGTAALAVFFTWFVLSVVAKIERRIDRSNNKP
jgi:putative Mg2+ transporter-C (MgtC) family protein